ncbi:AMIN-like domain-containing (lipo)protein [Saccharothrix hoggarensis]|uniref:AMIN-like domain-containing protein n=1 Tax=Saccharothrix hoggarensis TaxID=913853 RepID=A0ABW3QX54_9PSEU
MNNRFGKLALLALAMVAVGVVVPAASASTSASTSALSAGMSMTQTPVLTGIRSGRHADFDRVVLDLSGHRPQFYIRCVDRLVEDGSGNPVPLPGSYFLEVRSAPAAAHDDNGNSTYTGPRKFETPALANVQAVAITGDFEANLTVGLGLRRDSWHRVFLLDSPTRVVIDVGH